MDRSMTARCISGVALAVSVTVLSACGSGPASGDAGNPAHDSDGSGAELGDDLGLIIDMPQEQAIYFEDDRVTLSEYNEAFQRFVECAHAAGQQVTVNETDPVTGQVIFTASERVLAAGHAMYDSDGNELPVPSNPTNNCYQQHFDQVKIWFDMRDPTVVAAMGAEQSELFDMLVAPCLESNEVEIPTGLVAGSSEHRELYDTFHELRDQDRCP